jgi:hypothetical protein
MGTNRINTLQKKCVNKNQYQMQERTMTAPILVLRQIKHQKSTAMEAFMNSSFGTFLSFLFATHFSTRSWQSFLLLTYGWSLSHSRHTIANYIWLSGGTKYKHFSQFYSFFSQSILSVIDQLWCAVLWLIDDLLPDQAVIELIVDDTTRKKSGRKIQGASHYQNRAGSARQEYRTLWGINLVYVIACVDWHKGGSTFKLSLPVGLRIYLKQATALKLKRPFHSRSYLAREIIDFITGVLAHRHFIIKADGGYATKEFLRNLPVKTQVNGRFLIKGRLYGPPRKPKDKKAGRPPVKGDDLGTPRKWMQNPKGWTPHPEEKGAYIKTLTGIWHSVLPGVMIQVVAVWRKDKIPTDKRSGKKELEAFFSTDLSLSSNLILKHYAQRWAVEIDIRDGYAYYGLGKDHCRNLDRIFGVNSFRILLATCRTLWFIQYFQNRPLELKNLRPWYRRKRHPTQLDIISAAQEAFSLQGIYPVPRFITPMDEINLHTQQDCQKAA